MNGLGFLSGQVVAVLGLGKSGLATADALRASGATALVWDDNADARREAEAAGYKVTDFIRGGFHGASCLVQSPGIPHTLPRPNPVSAAAKAAGIPIFIDIDLLYRANPRARYVGITGTNGKSTTTALIHHILEQSGHKSVIGGNFGPPALSLPSMDATGTYVLELSSYQLELTQALVCDVAALLNLTPDHLDRHGDMAGYLAAKANIFRRGDRPQTFILGVDDDWCAGLADRLAKGGARVVHVSAQRLLASGFSYGGGKLYVDGEAMFDMREAPALPGAHNAQNALAALAACRALGVSDEKVLSGLRSFPGLAHRQQLVMTIDNVRFINDSKATNADAAGKALGCYDDIYWIAGGRQKAGGLSGLEPYMKNIRHAFLIGEAAADFGRWLDGRAPSTQCGDLETAVRAAATAAFAERRPGAVVLLSPACASWDQFASFEARGQRFIALVKALPANTNAGAAA